MPGSSISCPPAPPPVTPGDPPADRGRVLRWRLSRRRRGDRAHGFRRTPLALDPAAGHRACDVVDWPAAATLLHTARFRWGYPPTWIWTGVYALAPVGVTILARRQRAITVRPAEADPRLRLLRILSLVFGAALLAGAIAQFAMPADLGRDWPWPLTTLVAQAIAAWCAMIAAALLWCAYDCGAPTKPSSHTSRSEPGASRCWHCPCCTPVTLPAPARRC